MAFEDEFNAPAIVLAEGLVAMSHVDGRFHLIQVEPAAMDGLPILIRFDREAAERLAVWLRCRLDQPRSATQVASQARRPVAPGMGKTPDLTPEQRLKRREGIWFLRAHYSGVPADLRRDDGLARWIDRQGITYRYRTLDLHGTAMIWRECEYVPEQLPEWLAAYEFEPSRG